MQFRHEIKYLITPYMQQMLSQRAAAVMHKDVNAEGAYQVTSIYFDDQYDSAYHDKQGGIANREKFRVRFYNHNQNSLRFECKIKQGELSRKETAVLSPSCFQEMLNCDFTFASDFTEPVWQRFNILQKTRLMRPVAVVSFEREAYTFQAGNVRVTFDSCLTASNSLEPGGMHYPTMAGTILEVKYDDFLPSVISELFRGAALNRLAISKYCIARERLWEVFQYGFRTT